MCFEVVAGELVMKSVRDEKSWQRSTRRDGGMESFVICPYDVCTPLPASLRVSRAFCEQYEVKVITEDGQSSGNTVAAS